MGVTTTARPKPIPVTTRPTMRTDTEVARLMINAAARKKASATMITVRRPAQSVKGPPIIAPIAKPTARMLVTS